VYAKWTKLFPISGSALAAKKKAFFAEFETSLIFLPSTSYGGYPRPFQEYDALKYFPPASCSF
jgi:hypothetical protein